MVKKERGNDYLKQNLLSVLQVSLNDPSELQESIGSFVVPQIYALAGVFDDVTCAWISRRPISDKLLQIGDIIGRHCESTMFSLAVAKT